VPKEGGNAVKVNVVGRRLSLGSALFVVAYAAVFSALIFHQQIVTQPVSLAVLFFIIGMLGTLRSLIRISDQTTRHAFLLKGTIRNLYLSLYLCVVFWIANRRRLDWMLVLVLIAILPDWLHWFAQRRMTFGVRRDRVLKILDYFVIAQAAPSHRYG